MVFAKELGEGKREYIVCLRCPITHTKLHVKLRFQYIVCACVSVGYC